MDSKKIAIIICVNNELYYQECLYYIEKLYIPDAYTIEVFAVRQSDFICHAYNQVMKQSDAKYKIYMHQDVFIINQNFPAEMLSFFDNNSNAGMLGVLGCQQLPKDNWFYKCWDTGNVIGYNETKYFHNYLNPNETKVKAIDGMLMATQYDLPWREDCITGWDFYDFSQSLEFQKNGYELWIPKQEKPWCIHDCGCLNLTKYDSNREEFLTEYRADFALLEPDVLVYGAEKMAYRTLMMDLKERLKELMFSGHREQAREIVADYYDERYIDTEWVIIKKLLSLEDYLEDKETEFLQHCNSWQEAYEAYLAQKFRLRREKYQV